MKLDKLLHRFNTIVKGEVIEIRLSQNHDTGKQAYVKYIKLKVFPNYVEGNPKAMKDELIIQCTIPTEHQQLILDLQAYLDRGDIIILGFTGIWSGFQAYHCDQHQENDKHRHIIMLGLTFDTVNDIYIYAQHNERPNKDKTPY